MAETDFTDVKQSEILEKDINDVFDSIAFSEELICNKALEEGLIRGKKDGTYEGWHLGFHKGFELGSEIGYYRGLTKVLIKYFSDLTPERNEKILPLLKKLINLLDGSLEHNCQDVDIIKKLNYIRANIKKLNSLLKLNISFPRTPEMSF